jgi:hypothetical protein
VPVNVPSRKTKTQLKDNNNLLLVVIVFSSEPVEFVLVYSTTSG